MPWKECSVMDERMQFVARLVLEFVRPKTVTHVTGTFCNPCLRVGPKIFGECGRTRTFDPCLKRALLYQLSYAPILLP